MQTRVRTKYSQEPEIKVQTQSQENRNSRERNRNSEDKVLLPLGIHSESKKNSAWEVHALIGSERLTHLIAWYYSKIVKV